MKITPLANVGRDGKLRDTDDVYFAERDFSSVEDAERFARDELPERGMTCVSIDPAA
jgi:hypothetical protein